MNSLCFSFLNKNHANLILEKYEEINDFYKNWDKVLFRKISDDKLKLITNVVSKQLDILLLQYIPPSINIRPKFEELKELQIFEKKILVNVHDRTHGKIIAIHNLLDELKYTLDKGLYFYLIDHSFVNTKVKDVLIESLKFNLDNNGSFEDELFVFLIDRLTKAKDNIVNFNEDISNSSFKREYMEVKKMLVNCDLILYSKNRIYRTNDFDFYF